MGDSRKEANLNLTEGHLAVAERRYCAAEGEVTAEGMSRNRMVRTRRWGEHSSTDAPTVRDTPLSDLVKGSMSVYSSPIVCTPLPKVRNR